MTSRGIFGSAAVRQLVEVETVDQREGQERRNAAAKAEAQLHHLADLALVFITSSGEILNALA
jgi:hypothetical protein